MNYIIRNEEEKDYTAVEELNRISFWNVNFPGASEHYLAHILRTHPDFIKALDFVIEKDGRLIANIMYTKCKLIADDGTEKQILTFGPVCVHPDYQRQGYGKKLIAYSFDKARELGYDTVVIFGHPSNYVNMGFESCQKHNVCVGKFTPGAEDNTAIFPTAMLVKELQPGCLDGRRYHYVGSTADEFTEADAEKFDKTLPPLKKEVKPCQEEFYIYSHSSLAPLEEKKMLVHIIQEHTAVLFTNLKAQIEQSDLNALLDGLPNSRYLFHALHSLDRWYINPDDYTFPGATVAGVDEHFSVIDEKRPGYEQASDLHITKEQLLKYKSYVEEKINAYLSSLNDDMLAEKVSPQKSYTRLGLILSQFRHFMFHLGMSETLTFENDHTWPEYTGYSWTPTMNCPNNNASDFKH